ncbi:MAG: DUF4920 domain-containing protein [Chitinophagales bacterium]
MKKYLAILVIGAGTFALVSCGGKDKNDGGPDDMDMMSQNDPSVFQLAAYANGDTTKHFGKAINDDNAENIQNIAADPQKADGFSGKVTGKVVSVCQAKGCWMTLDAGNGQTVMVTFKDYGFFVPKDIAGKTVTLEGTANVRTVSVDEQRHLAGDAGKSEAEINAITEPKQELRFEADGVLLH